jgi:xanthine dehydrogenase accessory factor
MTDSPLALIKALATLLSQQPVVLATVVQIKGSVPREAGAKMLIGLDQIIGTIGGGAGEAKVIEQAQTVLQTGQKQWVEIDLTGSPQRIQNTQGICGGTMQVWLERWTSDQLPLVEQIGLGLQAGQVLQLVTPFAPDQSPYLALPKPNQPDLQMDAHRFSELLRPAPTLLIVGAGHVGEQLAQVAHIAGFQVVVQDDRPEWANPQRYPNARTLTEPIAAALPHLPHPELYAALVTRGYRQDLEALLALLTRPVACRYIGMIGSKKRVQQVYQALLDQQPAFQPQLCQIYAPIGLDLGALTPGEIAVSICAELILVRRGGTGKLLSERLRTGGR